MTLDGGARPFGGGGNGGKVPANYALPGLASAASWEPDVWGRLRRAVASAQASAQASEADLAAARLSAQGELATDYFALRVADAAGARCSETVAGYERA